MQGRGYCRLDRRGGNKGKIGRRGPAMLVIGSECTEVLAASRLGGRAWRVEA